MVNSSHLSGCFGVSKVDKISTGLYGFTGNLLNFFMMLLFVFAFL
jgi:hypothetical protein